nr:hypothetical protein [uncultured Flavobacterium sp.]
MKKLILALILSLAPFTIKAQTLEQTMEYIEANVLNYSFSKYEPTKCLDNNIIKTIGYYQTSGYPPVSIAVINIQDIKSVSYSSKSDYISIVITGNSYSQKYIYPTNNLEEERKQESFVELILLPNTPETAVQKIIKAIKHAAKLGGAKLINEDLFK